MKKKTGFHCVRRRPADWRSGAAYEVEIVDNRLRRYYRLTPDGEKRLAAEAGRLHSHATAALRRLNLNLAGGAA